MHELSIAMEIHRAGREAVSAEGPGRIVAVRVAVGELAGVEPSLLRYAWEALVAGGPDDGASIEVEFHPARQDCPSCRASVTRAPGSWLRLCPSCASPLVVQGGFELDLMQVEFETAAGAPEMEAA